MHYLPQKNKTSELLHNTINLEGIKENEKRSMRGFWW